MVVFISKNEILECEECETLRRKYEACFINWFWFHYFLIYRYDTAFDKRYGEGSWLQGVI